MAGPSQQRVDSLDLGKKTLWLALVLLSPLYEIGQGPLSQHIYIPGGRPMPGQNAGQAVARAVRLDEIALQ